MTLPDSLLIESLCAPLCPICGQEMTEAHSKTWMGKSWSYISIIFRCDENPPHTVVIRARTEDEWEQHKKLLKFAEEQ